MVIGWRPPKRTPQLESHWFKFHPGQAVSDCSASAVYDTGLYTADGPLEVDMSADRMGGLRQKATPLPI
jgi:hypothetical protein